MIFKKDKLEAWIKLSKDPNQGFIRKNTVFKVLMKDKKGNAKVIAQWVCNISDLVYSPDKPNGIFEQKINLKFHKGYDAGANLLKPHATLNLNVKSVLDLNNLDVTSQFTPKTDMKTADHRRFMSDIDDSLIFDIEDKIIMNSQIDDLSMISIGSVSKPKTKNRPIDALHSGSQSYRSMQKEVMKDFDMGKLSFNNDFRLLQIIKYNQLKSFIF